MINYGKQTIEEDDVKAVLETLNSDYLTTGPKVKEFEKKFAHYVGAKFAVAVSNGTSALHLACLAAGLEKDQEVITTPITFAASANCALYCNARPVFVDINEQGLIDEEKILEKINEKTKILIPVHYSGLCCNMEKIKEIANKYNLIVIEDACHALGAKYKETRIGECTYSDLCVFSFHPVKHITTGEGGMITTNSEKMYNHLLKLRTHGITKEPDELKFRNHGPWYHEMQRLGFNYRITDFQCALGMSQLTKINDFIDKRRKIAKRYDDFFEKNINLRILKEKEGQFNSYHLYIIRVEGKETRLKLFNFLKDRGILCQVHYIPVYLHPYYQELGYSKGICPNAERFYEEILSIPIYPSLIEDEQNKIIKSIGEFFER